MTLTLKPERAGGFVLVNDEGDPVAVGMARASRTVPGYVTIVVLNGEQKGLALRVPSDWPVALQREGDTRTCVECGRLLHGYVGPKCRYCDGTAE